MIQTKTLSSDTQADVITHHSKRPLIIIIHYLCNQNY